jgi:WD40 repeat protein
MSNQNDLNKNIYFLEPLKYENKVKIFDIKFHPYGYNVAFVDFSGKLKIMNIGDTVESRREINSENEANFQLEIKKNFSVSKTKESIYSLDYSHDGDKILTSSYDGELVLVDLNKTSVYKRINKAHEETINKVKFINENLFCSSGAKGSVKFFDLRTNLKKEFFEFNEQSEEITDFDYSDEHKFLLSTSIDGTLAVYDIRKVSKFKLYALSDCIEDEFYSMKIVKNGQKVACGTSEGPIALFNWDWFGDFKDRIMGHPGSVNCLEKYDENFLISGCEDGGIRFVSISPKYIHSMISDKNGSNANKEYFKDVTGLSLTKDKNFLATISNINTVKIYNIGEINIDIKGVQDEAEDRIGEDDDFEKSENNYEENENSENSFSEKDDNDEDNYNEESESSNEKFEDEEGDEEDHLEPEDEQNNIYSKNENQEDSDNSKNESFSSSFSEKKIKKKTLDKSLKLQKKRNSEHLIEKERRKKFFSEI